MLYIKFGDHYTIRQTAKLKSSPNILVIRYSKLAILQISQENYHEKWTYLSLLYSMKFLQFCLFWSIVRLLCLQGNCCTSQLMRNNRPKQTKIQEFHRVKWTKISPFFHGSFPVNGLQFCYQKVCTYIYLRTSVIIGSCFIVINH